MIERPKPPPDILTAEEPTFIPAPEIITWAQAVFLSADSPIANPDHDHLAAAQLGALWTNLPNSRQMRTIMATAEMPAAQGGAWTRGRFDFLLARWFGFVPDFLITVDALNAAALGDDEWCALIDHELYHCGQAKDSMGLPRFTRDGNPVYAIRGHDIEEFVGIVRRYGAAAAGVQAMVDAASAGRLVSAKQATWACGTCGKGA